MRECQCCLIKFNAAHNQIYCSKECRDIVGSIKQSQMYKKEKYTKVYKYEDDDCWLNPQD